MSLTPAEKSARLKAKDPDAYRERKRNWAKTESQKEYRRNYMRGWRDRNREKHNQQAREYGRRNKEKISVSNRARRLKKLYDITVPEYEKMVADQGGRCFICGTDKPAGGKLHIDHDHKTGEVRKLLCSRCNGSLGWFEKYAPSILDYLK